MKVRAVEPLPREALAVSHGERRGQQPARSVAGPFRGLVADRSQPAALRVQLGVLPVAQRVVLAVFKWRVPAAELRPREVLPEWRPVLEVPWRGRLAEAP